MKLPNLNYSVISAGKHQQNINNMKKIILTKALHRLTNLMNILIQIVKHNKNLSPLINIVKKNVIGFG